MNRRELMLLLGGAMTAPRGVGAQQKSMPVIGILGDTAPDPQIPSVAAFWQGLRGGAAPYREGRDRR
jgi:hypothetical protein